MVRQKKKRNYFLKNSLQGKLLFGFFLFVAGGFLFLLVLLGTFSADPVTPAVSNIQPGSTPHDNPLIQLRDIFISHWLFILSTTVFTAIAALLLSHRIAGPMFRFERVLDNMLKKDLSNSIHLRRNDEGKKLAKKIDALNRDLSITFKEIRSSSGAIRSLLERADTKADNLPEKQRQELKSIYWNLQENNKKIQKISHAYRLREE
ncbi:MAG: methyl-accepting chemotaxis protein [Deltaproteobacteria bacterium]|nr:methyl-accepting chemotaxis protein [Deltaproteobacteria bacterium]MBW2658206.1 methyl-accepting chemotaxis protein [Deltaproteobacteria bacterium]